MRKIRGIARLHLQQANYFATTGLQPVPDDITIRPMTADDIPRLEDIQPGFTSATILEIERTGSGIETGWRLVERTLDQPYEKGSAYDFDRNEQRNIRERFQRGDGLHLVAECGGRIVGILDMTPEEWNSTVWVWNLMLDHTIRRQGIGKALFDRAADWARRYGYRALIVETQTNNVPACKFYVAMGCHLDGLRMAYYHNDDLQRGEVALFWIYPIE